jgi:hemoglobin-like flavoprotein
MTPQQIALVQTSFAKVVPIAGTAADLFYGRLFEIAPDVRRLFPQDLSEQKKKLMTMLDSAVAGLSHLDTLLPAICALGERHADYDVKVEHFTPIGSALLWMLEQELGNEFTPDVEDAWATAYGMLSQAMIDAMMKKVSKAA